MENQASSMTTSILRFAISIRGSGVVLPKLLSNKLGVIHQEVIAPVVWVGSEQVNVMALMLDTLDVLQALAQQTASHTHSNTGAPQNAGEIAATGEKSDALRRRYAPVIG